MCLYIVSTLKSIKFNVSSSRIIWYWCNTTKFEQRSISWVRERILANPRKSLPSASSEDVCDIGFSGHLSKNKRWKPLQSQCQCGFSYFWVTLVSSNFLKISISIHNLADIHFLENSFISKVFPSTSCIFVFTIGKIIARDSRLQYPFMHKFNSTLNILSSIANQTSGLALAMRFYRI